MRPISASSRDLYLWSSRACSITLALSERPRRLGTLNILRANQESIGSYAESIGN
ncbi:hypothetical protein CGRA01v4_06957 [Colletotrichum graminicola]|nr:hypothetical protein CGRA01v4_06957 [Colletotrichum graminicola]